MTKPILSQELLRALLHYDPKTGIFTWLVTCGHVAAGSKAGTLGSDHYTSIMVNYKHYKAHRLAWLYMTGKFPKDEIDHVNHDKVDNRFSNLREVNHSQNQRNRSMSKNNSSGHTGVSFRSNAEKWCVHIGDKYLGLFDLKSDAIICRKKAEIEHNYHPNHGA